jgi:hypothetical protein
VANDDFLTEDHKWHITGGIASSRSVTDTHDVLIPTASQSLIGAAFRFHNTRRVPEPARETPTNSPIRGSQKIWRYPGCVLIQPVITSWVPGRRVYPSVACFTKFERRSALRAVARNATPLRSGHGHRNGSPNLPHLLSAICYLLLAWLARRLLRQNQRRNRRRFH